MPTQVEKGAAFHALHTRHRAFIIPNPWDVGTSRVLAQLGFEALATTSAGYAFSVGQQDSTIGREETMAHVAAIVSATDLPVSADLENGFGDAPEIVAETIKLAAEAGLVGGSIEDVSGRVDLTLYERLQAYQAAGADVLYAPGLTSKDDIATVVSSVDRPVNVVMGLQGVQLSLAELSAIGVRRVSVGSALSRAALGAFLRAAGEMREHGTFTFAEAAVNYRDINTMFTR